MNFPSPQIFPGWAGTASRRCFLSSASAVVVTVMTGSWTGRAESGLSVMSEKSLKDLRLAAFAGQLHSDFFVTDAPDGRVALTLMEAGPGKALRQHSADAPDAQHEKFSLMFSGPQFPLLPQRIYRFEHPRIGWFEMFIVPVVTERADRQHYQAVFNRPAAAEKI